MRPDQRKAFTLIELLMAMGIAVTMIAIAAYAQLNITNTTERSLAMAALDLRSSALVKKLREDFAGMQPHCALNVHISGGSDPEFLSHLTFMSGIPFEMSDKGISSGSYKVSSAKTDQWYHDLVWVRWQFDEHKGLRRGMSARLEGIVKNKHHAGKGDNSYFWNTPDPLPANLNGKAVIPQREYKYFDNFGDFENRSSQEAGAQVNAWIYNWDATSHSYFGANNSWFWTRNPKRDVQPFFNRSEPKHFFQGNETPIPDAYAAALPWPNRPDETHPGLPVLYHKNRLDLLGVPGDEDNPYYPSQLATVSSGVELFTVSVELRDGTLLERGASTTLEEIDGLRMTPGHYRPGSTSGPRSTSDGEADYTRHRRPRILRVSFLMHNLLIDPTRPYKEDPMAADFPGEDMSSIHYLRYVFYDELAPADQTMSTFRRMIEAAGGTVIEVHQAIMVY